MPEQLAGPIFTDQNQVSGTRVLDSNMAGDMIEQGAMQSANTDKNPNEMNEQ